MDLAARLEKVEETHRRLRAAYPNAVNLGERAEMLRAIVPALEDVRQVLDGLSNNPDARDLRQMLLAVRTDAEHFAGKNAEAEGYRHAEDVWTGYERLRAAVRER